MTMRLGVIVLALVGLGLVQFTDFSARAADKDKKSKAKVVTTKSGLKYIELKVGKGQTAKKDDHVVVHYTGWLDKGKMEKGKKFDSSVDRNEPFDFTLGAMMVIKGWDEGVQGMKVGGKRRLVIPAELAYGDKDRGPIPANSTLIFDVELLKIEKE